MHYGYDPLVWSITEQYLVGTQLLIAPVLYEGATDVTVYFPQHSGPWVHIVSVCVFMFMFLCCVNLARVQ